MVRLFLLALSLSATPTLADEHTVLSIDLLRNSDAGVIHTAVRCKANCEILQTLQGVRVFSTTVKRESMKNLIETVLNRAPAREVSSEKSPLPRESKSPMHWRFIDDKRIVQGGFTVKPTEEVERQRMPLYQAVLTVEQWLDRQLARNSK